MWKISVGSHDWSRVEMKLAQHSIQGLSRARSRLKTIFMPYMGLSGAGEK